MKTLDQIGFTPSQEQALAELCPRLQRAFDLDSINLYGSVTRGETDEESDIDLLIVTKKPLPRTIRHQITDIVFEINLRYDTNFSTLVVDQASWESGAFSVLPLREEILREGIAL